MDMTQFVDVDAEYEEVLCEVKDWVARVTINRPQNYNAYCTNARATIGSTRCFLELTSKAS